MAQSETFLVDLSRPNSSVPWGFRLQGGADFSTPLSIQLVQPGSVADQSGLQAGDGVLQINGAATEILDHEAAKMEIIRAGNQVQFLVMRGAVATWKPKVTPMSELKPSELQTHTLEGEAAPIQRTSLAANKQPALHIGSAHNRAAKPFGASSGEGRVTISPERHISVRDSFGTHGGEHRSQLQDEYLQECGGTVPNVDYSVNPSMRQGHAGQAPYGATSPQSGVMHAQYNTPIGMYSNKNVNDTFNQQADVMKNEFGSMSLSNDQTDSSQGISQNNNNNIVKALSTEAAHKASESQQLAYKSPVMTAVEHENEPEPNLYTGGRIQSRSFKLLEQGLKDGQSAESPLGLPAGMRSVQAPKANMKMTGPRYKQPNSQCYVCGNTITGVFVRVKEHCLHADCLRCAQCKRSLKNIGYIWVKDKIYCVQHARELTRPPGGGYTAYVIDAPDGV